MYFINNSLKINDSKTEIILICNPQKTSKIHSVLIKVGLAINGLIKSICNLGIYFDTNYTFKTQINILCNKSFMQLRNIRQLKNILDTKTLEKVTHSFITRSLDPCNNIYYNLPDILRKKLQIV